MDMSMDMSYVVEVILAFAGIAFGMVFFAGVDYFFDWLRSRHNVPHKIHAFSFGVKIERDEM